MPAKDTENTDGNFSEGTNHLEGVDMRHQEGRLSALTGIISGLDEEGNDLPPGETREPETTDEPGDIEVKAHTRKRKPKAEGDPQNPPDDDGEVEEGDDTGDRVEAKGIPDEGNDPGDSDAAGDEDDAVESFEAMMEVAGVDVDAASDLMFDVVVEGETQQVPYKELVKGYRRQQDLTRGFQEVSEAKKQTADVHQEIADQYRQGVQQFAASLKALDAQMQFDTAQIDAMRVSNPEAAAAAVARNQRNQKAFEQGLQHVQAMETERQKHAQAAEDAKTQHSRDMLLSRHPKLRTDEGFKKFDEDFTKFLVDKGFTQEDVGSITDWRIVEIAMQAMDVGKVKKMEKSIAAKDVKKPNKRPIKKRRASTAKGPGNGVDQRREAERAQSIRQGKKGSLASFLVDSGMA